VFVIGVIIFAQGAGADERADLIAQIVAAGSNDAEEERHSVAIDECTMTTFRWKNMGDGTWKLWTSFVFYMPDVVLIGGKDGRRYLHVPDAGDRELAVVNWEMKAGKTKIQEYAAERNIKGESRQSLRGDGTTHRIRETGNGFLYMHLGEGVGEKARVFTVGFAQYVRQYCTFLG